MDDLGGIRDGEMHGAGVGPLPGGISGFFEQFALRAGQRVFARIELAGREFGHDAADRIAELALEQHAPVVQHGNDDHRARMHDVLAPGLAAVGQAHGVAARLQETAIAQRLAVDQGFGQVGIVGSIHGGSGGRMETARQLTIRRPPAYWPRRASSSFRHPATPACSSVLPMASRSTLLRQRWYCATLSGVSRTAGAGAALPCSVMRNVEGGDLLPSCDGKLYSRACCAWAVPNAPSRHARTARLESAVFFMGCILAMADGPPDRRPASGYRNVARGTAAQR